MSNVIFCELICGADEHTYFNSRLVLNVSMEPCLLNSKLTFIGDKNHFDNVLFSLNEIGFSNTPISFKKIKLPNRGYSEKRRIFYDFVNLFKCLIISLRYGKDTRLFILTTSPNILFFFSIFEQLVTFKVSFIFHSILSDIEKKPYTKKIDYFFGIYRALIFAKKCNYDYILLGKSIKKHLLSIIPDFNCRSIFHPMAPAKDITFEILRFPITIGFVGHGSLHKGFDLFLELHTAFKNDNFFRFKFIGRVSDEFKSDLRLRDLEINDNYLSDEDYLFELKSLNYMLILHDQIKYGLTPSGTFVDAIEQKIPVIGIKNPFIQEYFKEFGMMGYILDDFKELIYKLNEMSKISEVILAAEYDFFKKNMHYAQTYITKNNFIYNS